MPLLAGCTGTLSAELFGASLPPETLAYWNLFGGGDGTRTQAMEADYMKQYGPHSLQSTMFTWGNPYYSKVALATSGVSLPTSRSPL